ncbi:glycoside hydrolase family 108 protein [Acinetobacter stercoris]|uniref:Putative Peptidoglycan domain protein n=1 Tax=Acinetobacter stercoris TaxID=2126983 RepID=A0A2U3N4F9_9GAMM|nr:glycosyl hydrolase 108 family protein [Acinetobacter stercoris]SPL72533.1 putative Peptidoglycan domain protein [Acinetobacter stercoris]
MSKLVNVIIQVFDNEGKKMPGFPLIRGPKNGRMASEAYTDKDGFFEFQASPNRDIEIKLLSPNDSFDEVFYCKSGVNSTRRFNVRLKYSRGNYVSKTRIIWLSKHSKERIIHTNFKINYLGKTSVLSTENAEREINSIIGEPVTLSYIFPDGVTLSKSITYLAKRKTAAPLFISVDNYLNNTNTQQNEPNTNNNVDPEHTNCTTKFHIVSRVILRHEGGYVNDPNDSGGATNKGIAWNTWTKYAQVDLGVAPTLDNLKKISDDQAEVIYRKRYWEPKGFCQIKNDRVGLMVYDWTITSGGAAKEIQKLLVNAYHQKIAIDGVMGSQTINALNSISDQIDLLNSITKIRKQYYTSLAFKKNGEKSKNYKFLKGWLNRVDDCLKVEL